MFRRTAALWLGLGLVIGASCAADRDEQIDGTEPSGALTVLAASALADAFTALVRSFGDEYPAVTVTTSFAGSSELVAQLVDGAPGDVFAAADEITMQRLVDAGDVRGEPVVFATARLQIAVEPGNPLGLDGLADLADPAVLFVTAAPEVPIGRYTAQVLDSAGVEVTPRSLEQSARGVLNKVALGEADAGIVYETDVRAAGARVTGVEIAADVNVVARFPIVVTGGASNPIAASAFVDHVTSPAGREILAGFGFGEP